MAEINLLPLDLSPSRGSLKFAVTVKKISLILGGIFVFISIIGIIFIVFEKSQINISLSRETSLKQNIGALVGTEQKLFLIKDRLAKIKTAFGDKNALDSFEILNSVTSNLPGDVSISSVQINASQTEFAVISTSSLGMASFLNSLVTSNIYKNLTLKGFMFTQGLGYTITLDAS